NNDIDKYLGKVLSVKEARTDTSWYGKVYLTDKKPQETIYQSKISFPTALKTTIEKTKRSEYKIYYSFRALMVRKEVGGDEKQYIDAGKQIMNKVNACLSPLGYKMESVSQPEKQIFGFEWSKPLKEDAPVV